MVTDHPIHQEDSSCLPSCCGFSAIFGEQKKNCSKTTETDPKVIPSKRRDLMKAISGKHETVSVNVCRPRHKKTRPPDARLVEKKENHELGNQNTEKNIHTTEKTKREETNGAVTAVKIELDTNAASFQALPAQRMGVSKAVQTKQAKHQDDNPDSQESLVRDNQEVKEVNPQKIQAATDKDPSRSHHQTITEMSVTDQFSLDSKKTTRRPLPGRDAHGNPIKKARKSIKSSKSMTGVLIILSILTTLILWGRLCAIFCISIFLYLMPILTRIRGKAAAKAQGKIRNGVDMDSEEYKKKVIMGGILERHHKN